MKFLRRGHGRSVRCGLEDWSRQLSRWGWRGSPLPLERDGTRWTLELSVEPEFHHFGFLVDGEWWIPEGVQGAVPDEWGRVNATMVVPDQEREP